MKPFTISSAAAFDLVGSIKCCRPGVTASQGKLRLWLEAQLFHLLIAPMYFFVAFVALLLRTVLESASASLQSSGSCRVVKSGHIP